ncbi:MAG: inorganic phosphate transporter [Prevotella sp.]
MEIIYLLIVVFLLILAVFDLFVGVSNDAVNFLNSAIGAKVAKFKTVMIIASVGVVIGAVMSAGMMDVARHGIMYPANYTFHEVMTIFLAVMVTDVIVLDMFNTLGLPTSTTVSLVFELLGGTFILAILKMNADPSLNLDMLLNSDKALSVIIAIFVSVAIAFVVGMIVMWISRVVFTFAYQRHLRYTIAVFGGIAFTLLAYFIFIKGLGKSPFISTSTRQWVAGNTPMLLATTFVCSSLLMQVLHWLRVNVFKVVVLMGTFALAMAFAGNDLVNFIGVPMAGLDSYNDFMANGNGDNEGFMMTSLMSSAKTPMLYLMFAGVVMIIAMATSKKAQNVVKTSVDLARQDEGEEMFGSSKAARSIVRAGQDAGGFINRWMPYSFTRWIDSRFNREEAVLADGAAFDVVRAAVNLVLASMLIVVGTNYKLPLSTTYVTFMVAMGTSLADRAWSRESAVFRVTGVLSVIGGWFITAGVAFAACAIVCLLMNWGGFIAMLAFMVIAIWLLVRSQIQFARKRNQDREDDVFLLMMRTKDPEIVWSLLSKHVARTQSFVCRFALEQFESVISGLENNRLRTLKQCKKELDNEQEQLQRYRRKQLLAMKRIPKQVALERNTWYHLGVNSDMQYIYCLKRMSEPITEHIDNNFNPIPQDLIHEFAPVRMEVIDLMQRSESMLSTMRFAQYDKVLGEADMLKDKLSTLRKQHIDRMQNDKVASNMKISLIYLNVLQETQEFLSIMRHQLRAANRFLS